MIDDETPASGMQGEIVTQVGDDDIVTTLQRHDRTRKFGCAALLMMPECFAIGREQNGATRLMLQGDRREMLGKRLAVVHRAAKRDFRGQRPIETKNGEAKIIALP